MRRLTLALGIAAWLFVGLELNGASVDQRNASSTPMGAAGGSLSGSYPNPDLANSATSAGTGFTLTPGGGGNFTLAAGRFFFADRLFPSTANSDLIIGPVGTGTTVFISGAVNSILRAQGGDLELWNGGGGSASLVVNNAGATAPSGRLIQTNTLEATTTNGNLTIRPNGTGTTVIIPAGKFVQHVGQAGDPTGFSAGGSSFDTTREAHTFGQDVGTLGLVGLLSAITADLTGPVNTTTATEFGNGTTDRVPLPGNSLSVGKVIRLRGRGKVSAGANASQAFAFAVRFGTTQLATTVGRSGFARTANQTDEGFQVDADITVRTIGATGTVLCQITSVIGYAGSGNLDAGNYSNSPAPAAVTVDTTASQGLNVTAKFDVDTGVTESATMTQMTVEVLR